MLQRHSIAHPHRLEMPPLEISIEKVSSSSSYRLRIHRLVLVGTERKDNPEWPPFDTTSLLLGGSEVLLTLLQSILRGRIELRYNPAVLTGEATLQPFGSFFELRSRR